MKKAIILSFLCFLSTSMSCKKNAVSVESTDLPICIQNKIEEIAKLPVWNPPATVYSYSYKGKTVYGFSADCCDQYNTVYDENCNIVCSPSGGISGRGDGKCPDFQKEATNEKLIWQDTRKR